MGQELFTSSVGKAFFVKSCRIHVSGKPFTCGEIEKDFLASLGHQQQQDTQIKEEPKKVPSLQYHTAEKVIILQKNVRKLSDPCSSLFRTRVFTLNNSVSCAVNIGKHSGILLFVTHLRVHSRERRHVYGECRKSN